MLIAGHLRCHPNAQQGWEWQRSDGRLEGQFSINGLVQPALIVLNLRVRYLPAAIGQPATLWSIATDTVLQASKISKEYEKRGGDYENEAGSKNEPTKGAPKGKSDEKKNDEVKDSEDKPTASADKKDSTEEKPKANTSKKATGRKESKPKAPKKEKKAPTEGTRKSARVSGKRAAEPEEEQEKPPAKKSKTSKK